MRVLFTSFDQNPSHHQALSPAPSCVFGRNRRCEQNLSELLACAFAHQGTGHSLPFPLPPSLHQQDNMAPQLTSNGVSGPANGCGCLDMGSEPSRSSLEEAEDSKRRKVLWNKNGEDEIKDLSCKYVHRIILGYVLVSCYHLQPKSKKKKSFCKICLPSHLKNILSHQRQTGNISLFLDLKWPCKTRLKKKIAKGRYFAERHGHLTTSYLCQWRKKTHSHFNACIKNCFFKKQK